MRTKDTEEEDADEVQIKYHPSEIKNRNGNM